MGVGSDVSAAIPSPRLRGEGQGEGPVAWARRSPDRRNVLKSRFSDPPLTPAHSPLHGERGRSGAVGAGVDRLTQRRHEGPAGSAR